MKNTRKFISLILVLALCLSTFTTTNVDAKGKVQLNKKKITLTLGAKYKLKLKNYKKKVRWKSSNKKVASVSKKGKVTAKKKGTAKITAIAGKKKYVCKVIVKKSKRSSNNPSTVVPSTAAAVTSAMPGDTVTVLPTIAPNNTPLATPATTPGSTPLTTPTTTPDSTPLATPTAVPSSTPVTTPATTPSSTPVTTPLVTPTSTPLTTPVATPSSTPVTTPAATPAAMQDIPKFIGFKTYDDKELVTEDSELTTLSTNEMLALETPQTETAVTDTKSIENNLINKKEMLLVKLSYENKKRDNIVEIVLNDSDYGKKQIYTTAASVNKILSSDTYYDEEKDSYITDVLLQMPVTKSESKRIIEVEETCFLRETVGVKGYADLSSTRQTSVTFLVSEEPLPSYPQYFNFAENEEGGYTIVSWNQNYSLPDTVYIPPIYKGKPVNKLGTKVFDKATMTTLIIPETITEIGENMAAGTAVNLKKLIMKSENPPIMSSLALNDWKNCQIIVPEKGIYQYHNKGYWSSYKKIIYYQIPNGPLINGIPYDKTIADLPIALTENQATNWTKNGSYGQVKFNTDGTVAYSSQPTAIDDDTGEIKPVDMYNNGFAFYLDNVTKAQMDVACYHYVAIRIKTTAEVKIMTWSGNSEEEFDNKNDTWKNVEKTIENEDGSKTLIYKVSTLFYSSASNAKAIGITLKSPDGVAQSAVLYSIVFTNTIDKNEESDSQKDGSFDTMIADSLLSTGNNARLKNAIAKARDGKDVSLAYIGSTATETVYSNSKGFAEISANAFAKTYGKDDGSNIHFINAGMSGSSSDIGVVRYNRDVIDRLPAGSNHPDILFIEFSANDFETATNGGAYEGLIREALKSGSAVILIFPVFQSEQGGRVMESTYRAYGNYYDLAMISMGDSVMPYFENEGFYDWYFQDCFNPSNDGYQLMSDCIMNLMDTVDKADKDTDNITDIDAMAPLKTSAYQGIKIIDSKTTTEDVEIIDFIDVGSFAETDSATGSFQYTYNGKEGAAKFPNNWMHTRENGNTALTIKATCKTLMFVYKLSNSKTFGSADLYIDGEKKATLDGYDSSGWNNGKVFVAMTDDEAAEHTIELKMKDGDEEKNFTLLAIGYN